MQEVYWGRVKEQKAALEWGHERGRDRGKNHRQERQEKHEKGEGMRGKRRQVEELEARETRRERGKEGELHLAGSFKGAHVVALLTMERHLVTGGDVTAAEAGCCCGRN